MARSRPKTTVSLAVLAGLMPYAGNTAAAVKTMGFSKGFQKSTAYLTGFDPTTGVWDWHNLWGGLFPMIMGVMAHKIAGTIGINRALRGVPLLRI